ncbi:hypothetical protein SCP_0903110 [Sparassis crispa]|uniref:Glycosyl transferase 48 domain-containing protein n=1 Tax=Sparassis crispa TaxID=139825 RepID=A0A401GW73_9APHY|nr:hypothetical protein SCP_0903110 [Sparassis crispa]GBE86432.1 hypothetical protein SCP_0903110 [Sparassis crispa]
MITGYKKKKLGQPSEKLSGDVPWAGWCAVMFLEIIFPTIMAVPMVVAYLFVKSYPVDARKEPPNALLHIAIVSIGPILWNAAILFLLFLVSLTLLDTPYPKFGSFMALLAHSLGVIGVIGFFECLWFLDLVMSFKTNSCTSILVQQNLCPYSHSPLPNLEILGLGVQAWHRDGPRCRDSGEINADGG